MDTEALRRFLLASNAAGYAGGDEKEWVREADGSWTIPFERDGWRAHDNFFGGEPYGGRAVVFHDDRPVWLMAYYGWVDEASDAHAVYAVLRRALVRMPEEAPLRGPAAYGEGRPTYANAWRGDLTRFGGEERISDGGRLIYQATYCGGLVDRRHGV